MPKIDLTQIPFQAGSVYPGKLNKLVDGRQSQRVGDAGGLTQFGANIVELAPGAISSIRHFHIEQDEFVMVVSGECTLIDNQGEQPMLPGECAAFPANDQNGHHFKNNTDAPVRFLVIGTRTKTETAYYSDMDMMVKFSPDGFAFTRKDGSPLTADQIGDKND